MKSFILFILVSLALSVALKAQDPQFSQYYASPLYLNPAFAGSTEMHRVALNNRLQWPNLPQTYTTYALSYDYNMAHLNSGFGLLLTTDKAGSSSLRNTNAGFLYAYKIHLNNKWVITPGLNFSYTHRDIDYSKLLFPDQISSDGSGVLPVSPGGSGANRIEKVQYFDFGTGLLVYNRAAWFGGSLHHIPQPNTSFLGGNDRLPMKLTVHGGVKIPLYYGPQKLSRMSSISPSFIYKTQGEFDQLDVGMNFTYDPIMAGLWYRGLPIRQTVDDQFSRDAVTFIMGLNFKDLQMGYSYDITVSRLGANSGGAHEISLIYEFTYENLHRVKRKEKFMPCPSF
ncbi:type IX secretion system membrane protein PorP/SprF [Cytophagales bacterium LB-30]|uniref:Type IX secretion system membrane protein PorP/SprF n=1 Tax=Shiella aurantiaca TaxID=3058365 RepID=A0ABT8F4E4_9BACT|nr:type IX secretion system membrane protein PorP/SprF [Shiella aurantiaca]MDN4165263.1 type IX secretion system membrane protein PorP/SprF [Shiella aurantiaca]